MIVSGLDETAPSRSSAPGASWVFPRDVLRARGAFLAVRMNGAPLTADHGAPVRLVVPGWYGCSWIKWVNSLRAARADEPTTSQMREFSLRTHQDGVPALARDYAAPEIDLAATPIRVEQRRVAGRIEYRVVGIVWGGTKPVDRLAIRFSAGETPQPFTICPAPKSTETWSLWEYRWRPASPGVYSIALRAADPTIRTRRLDVSYTSAASSSTKVARPLAARSRLLVPSASPREARLPLSSEPLRAAASTPGPIRAPSDGVATQSRAP